MHRFTRRKALQTGGLLTAATVVPTGAGLITGAADRPADALLLPDGRIQWRGPTCACKAATIVDFDEQKFREPWETLMAGPNEIRWAAFAFDLQLGVGWLADRAMFMAELQRHVPGLAPVLGLLHEHLDQIREEDRGRCCG